MSSSPQPETFDTETAALMLQSGCRVKRVDGRISYFMVDGKTHYFANSIDKGPSCCDPLSDIADGIPSIYWTEVL